MNAGAKTVSLVLGSGGARGYAHIGAIEELLAQGYAIRSVAGASMGALIGGVYAAGKLDAYRDWARGLQKFDVLRLLDWTFRGGLIKGDRIIVRLRELIGDVAIENLPIPYTAVAVDILAQREVWFTRGPLFDAIRASIAIPTVFRPHHYEGRVLVDGGLLNPVPITPTLRDLTDCTIAVDLNAAPDDIASASPPDANTDPGLLETFARSLDAVQATLTRFKLAAQPPDLVVSIPRTACAFYEFHRAPELVELGRARTRAALAQWRGRIESDGGPAVS
ncbi:MAG: patatin-like phospholipase family protein [Xanthomonadaceae bacterium]|nr:patatin-like phospholipase family protein [Xanthomonadaceae bacterium]MDE1885539.1 patatin-like phospholipase family protein [Xanthomonadaceae bacterium]MDE1961826.1 patatin-like phospholipase family protein [Xanthomonadaceae bacterium]MDE2084717.1 patatin-like phospholipase family protein [Xanthomonadaceae bacterium]MDE2258499.1 patatin-like phospholipase family protein [Xanthomonadaceae bacterium]